jgi:hypothetical protein
MATIAASSLKPRAVPGAWPFRFLAHDAGSRAIYMNLRAEPYLAALLAGENSPLDLAWAWTHANSAIADAYRRTAHAVTRNVDWGIDGHQLAR